MGLNPGCSHHVRRSGVWRELWGDEEVVGGGDLEQQGGDEQRVGDEQQAREAGSTRTSHPPVPWPDCCTHPTTGSCQFGQRTATGSDWVLGWVLTKAQTRVWPRWSVDGVLWFCFYTWISWLATLPPNFYILIGWHSCVESTNLDGDVRHLWV